MSSFIQVIALYVFEAAVIGLLISYVIYSLRPTNFVILQQNMLHVT